MVKGLELKRTILLSLDDPWKNTKNAGRKIPRFGSLKFYAICCLKSNYVNYRINLMVENRKMNLLFTKQFKPQGFKNNYG